MQTKELSALQRKLHEIHAAITKLKASRESLHQEKKALQEQLQTIYGQAMSKDDIILLMCEIIDRRAAIFKRNATKNNLLQQFAYPPRNYSENVRHDVKQHFTLEDADRVLNIQSHIDTRLDYLSPCHDFNPVQKQGDSLYWDFYFLGNIYKSKLRDLLADCEITYSHGDREATGAPLAERRKQVAEIVAQIATIDEQIAALDADIISLEHPAHAAAQGAHEEGVAGEF